jgi:hypothetical protein
MRRAIAGGRLELLLDLGRESVSVVAGRPAVQRLPCQPPLDLTMSWPGLEKFGGSAEKRMSRPLDSLQQYFPHATLASEFFDRLNQSLARQYGFASGNTRFGEGACCDEINEPELLRLERHWGERFRFGGLAGYCHGGRTALAAVSHHVPARDGQRNLLLVAGPHIGYHDDTWGRVGRAGQVETTTCCGSLMAIVSAGYDELVSKTKDRLDAQQYELERLMLPFLDRTGEPGTVPSIVRATQFLSQRVDEDLTAIVGSLAPSFCGQIATVTGVTINTGVSNFFEPSMQRLYNRETAGTAFSIPTR